MKVNVVALSFLSPSLALLQETVPRDTDPLAQHPSQHKFRDEATDLEVPWVNSSRVEQVRVTGT